MTAVTLGRRLPDGTHLTSDDAGGYCLDENGTWSAVTPNGLIGNLGNHDVVEHDSGAITVTPSILIDQPGVDGWHGYLEHGVWREV